MDRGLKVYLIVVLSQLQHFLDNGLIELAVLTVVLQGQALHPALLMQVQQHLKNNEIDDSRVLLKTATKNDFIKR